MTPHPDSPGASPRSVTTRAEIGSAPSRRSDRPTAGTSVQHRDALVVGGGVAGLTAAWELIRAGLRPLVVEARGYTGGLVAAGVLAGVRVDLGADGFAVRGDAVTSMVDALGLEIVGPAGGGAGLFLPPGPGEPVPDDDPARGWRLHRFVRDALLGIPARPLADDVVAIIGAAAAERAARDSRLGDAGTRPGDPTDLASFVRTRMGDGALDRLVSPIVSGIYSRDPAVLAADAVLPGLREATARLGSLQAAVGEALERRRARGRGRSTADATTAGGLTRLTDALRSSVEAAGGDVLTRTGAQWLRPAVGEPATGLRADEPGGAPVGVEDGGVIPWDVAVAPTGRGATPSDEPVPIGPVRIVRAPRVVLACSAPAALRLLAGAGTVDGAEGGEGLRDGPGVLGGPGGSGEGRCRTDPTAPIGAPIARFMLAVLAPELAGAPMGSGLLVANAGGDRPVRAKALSHLNVKWPWIGTELAALHGPDAHALRLSYGRLGESRPEVDLDLALADVRALTGGRIEPSDVIDSALVRWDDALPPATSEHRERVLRLRSRVRSLPGLALTGAWVAGTGVAAVVEDARRQAGAVTAGGAGSLHAPLMTPAAPAPLVGRRHL